MSNVFSPLGDGFHPMGFERLAHKGCKRAEERTRLVEDGSAALSAVARAELSDLGMRAFASEVKRLLTIIHL